MLVEEEEDVEVVAKISNASLLPTPNNVKRVTEVVVVAPAKASFFKTSLLFVMVVVVVFDDVAFFKASSSSLLLPPFAERAPEHRRQQRLADDNICLFRTRGGGADFTIFCNEHFQKERKESSQFFTISRTRKHIHTLYI